MSRVASFCNLSVFIVFNQYSAVFEVNTTCTSSRTPQVDQINFMRVKFKANFSCTSYIMPIPVCTSSRSVIGGHAAAIPLLSV